MATVFGEEACSESTVKKWSLRFRGGRESVEDDPRMGRPVTATTSNNIALVAEMCDSDPHIAVEQLAGTLDLSTGSVHTILIMHLGMSNVCSRWVPLILTQTRKKTRLRIAKNFLEKYEHCDERRLSEICTGDETWIRYSEPPRKQQNKVSQITAHFYENIEYKKLLFLKLDMSLKYITKGYLRWKYNTME